MLRKALVATVLNHRHWQHTAAPSSPFALSEWQWGANVQTMKMWTTAPLTLPVSRGPRRLSGRSTGPWGTAAHPQVSYIERLTAENTEGRNGFVHFLVCWKPTLAFSYGCWCFFHIPYSTASWSGMLHSSCLPLPHLCSSEIKLSDLLAKYCNHLLLAVPCYSSHSLEILVSWFHITLDTCFDCHHTPVSSQNLISKFSVYSPTVMSSVLVTIIQIVRVCFTINWKLFHSSNLSILLINVSYFPRSFEIEELSSAKEKWWCWVREEHLKILWRRIKLSNKGRSSMRLRHWLLS